MSKKPAAKNGGRELKPIEARTTLVPPPQNPQVKKHQREHAKLFGDLIREYPHWTTDERHSRMCADMLQHIWLYEPKRGEHE